MKGLIHNHFILKVIWRKWPNPGDPALLLARGLWRSGPQRAANSLRRSTIGAFGSASGAIAVK
jgi:hypothetical protein